MESKDSFYLFIRTDLDDKEDLKFFKKCIVQYYCFKKTPNVDSLYRLPDFRYLIGTKYFNKVAQRVELFFIRNNDWSQTVVNPKFRNIKTGTCTNLLIVIAARYFYVIYVLNSLRGERTFELCDQPTGQNLIVPPAGECLVKPRGVTTCNSDFDIALLGARSGSLTALFSQFFQENPGQLQKMSVPGFGKTSEEVLDVNVHAFTLEFAMPSIFQGLPVGFLMQATKMNNHINYKVQEIVSAILKMASYNKKYFNDLMSDEIELKTRSTKHKLDAVFHTWVTQFQTFKTAVESFTVSSVYTSIMSFIHKVNVAYEMILGITEKAGTPAHAVKAISETAIALMYAAQTYHTRGTVRHVVGNLQMGTYHSITMIDCWVSMLENWADTVREYRIKCAIPGKTVVACLPKISKQMWRMLHAMHRIYQGLPSSLKHDLTKMDNSGNSGVRSIMKHWLNNVKRKGLDKIPANDPRLNHQTSNLNKFKTVFKCTYLVPHKKFPVSCMNAIHAEIRKYNRRLFIYLADKDKV